MSLVDRLTGRKQAPVSAPASQPAEPAEPVENGNGNEPPQMTGTVSRFTEEVAELSAVDQL